MPEVSRPIRGKIAAVVTTTQVAINRGESHSVTLGMKFAIYLSLGPIQDPDDPKNVLLESIRYKKGTIKVSHVFDKMSLCLVEGEPNYNALTTEDDYDEYEPPMEFPKVEAPLIKSGDWHIRVGDIIEEIEAPTNSN